ncbi:lactate racemase domain-containing protein [Stratiformator vulcanicus]|uniref:LarA-like N-terminal domain-containing protein n=1 Tax=Stratiformator vulcanicus TaxID=2527980 RepID=A0A517R0Y2_9PLAN|nr:lactate racemase domain-containing protein [Stratiformator vulcanicus]QDT37494.1 hypothetical protein Pan189_18740 [Stratiformator vulcanicus]
MLPENTHQYSIHYGTDRCLELDLPVEQVTGHFTGPARLADVTATLESALDDPVEFPKLEESVIPGDQVVVVVDARTPHLPELTAAVIERLVRAGIDADGITVVPSSKTMADSGDVAESTEDARYQNIKHDPGSEAACRYLASTSTGERIYLSSHVIDADVVISIGLTAFDPLLGYCGTNSVFYPWLSNVEAIQRIRGAGHRELGPDDERPLRQTVDEIGWLLGTQFTVQAVAGAGGGISQLLAGGTEPVFRRLKRYQTESWKLSQPERSETVVVAVDSALGDSPGQAWSRLAAAVDVARRLVCRDGRIVVLTDLSEEPPAEIAALARFDQPIDVVSALKRENAAVDLGDTSRLVDALDWARVYLLSQLGSDLVEDLFFIPLEHEDEVRRLLSSEDEILIVGSAQHAFGEVLD